MQPKASCVTTVGRKMNLIFQVIISQLIPSALDIIGALSIFMSALAITFEVQIYKAICGRCTCSRRSEMLFDE